MSQNWREGKPLLDHMSPSPVTLSCHPLLASVTSALMCTGRTHASLK